MRRASFFLLLILCTGTHPVPAAADDKLSEILERMHIHEYRNYNYTETRYLQLLAEPWKASGEMFITPRKMVIVQQKPASVLTVITADQMHYHDYKQDVDRSLKLERPYSVPGMEPLMLLLFGKNGAAELKENYTIDLEHSAQRWSLQLTPRKNTAHNISKFGLSGLADQGPDHLVLNYRDGDRTEWNLSLASQGASIQARLKQLLDQLQSRQQ